ncbi:MAG: hypothetical protein NC826_04210 [Candidatus Omnitrophica bacterium]|nr:hypothetical protein [Candidatus Omnitrophota bacterium]
MNKKLMMIIGVIIGLVTFVFLFNLLSRKQERKKIPVVKEESSLSEEINTTFSSSDEGYEPTFETGPLLY